MSQVFLGLGSNVDRDRHIVAGLDALDAGFGLQRISSVYESEALGFSGAPFYNLAVCMATPIRPGVLARELRDLEYRMGRPRDASRASSRTLDIDILCYGELGGLIEGVQLPREEVTGNAFVLCPLAEIAPDLCHPGLALSYRALWEAYPRHRQTLQRVDFRWGGQTLPFTVPGPPSDRRPRR